MRMTVFIVTVIMISVCSLSAKFVFIPVLSTWFQAQEYCRVNFTDLLPISTEVANRQFRRWVRSHNTTGWIGLYRYNTGSLNNEWYWSGGGPVTYNNWVNADPHPNSVFGYWTIKGWHGRSKHPHFGFYCFNLIVDGERKSWEEALVSCRQKRTSLTSLISRTEVLLAKQKIQQEHITDPVWIGLRFLRNHWMWVNMDPLEYQAWPEASQDHQCPVKGRCGALNKQGLWENWDCQEKLSFICS